MEKLSLVIALAELVIMSILLFNELKLFKGKLKNGISIHIFLMMAVAILDSIYVLTQMFKAGTIGIVVQVIHGVLFMSCMMCLSLGELQVLQYKVKNKVLVFGLLLIPALIYIFTILPYPNTKYIYLIVDGKVTYSASFWIYIQAIPVMLYRLIAIAIGINTFVKHKKDNKDLSELGLIFIIFSSVTLAFSLIVSLAINVIITQGFFLAVGLVYLISKLNMYEIKQTTARVTAVETELNMATNIQKNMLPVNFDDPKSKNKVEIYASMNPAKEVGGDFYDFYWIDDTHLALCVADVSGKGVPAALFMVIAKTIFRNACKTYHNVEEILKVVNEQLCEDNKDSMFVTCWAGILDTTTGIMKCSNAGHEFPVFAKHNNKFDLIKDKHGFPLAAINSAKYEPYELKLEKGDVLFVYTDGFPEANNEAGDMIGLEKMIDILNSRDSKDPAKLIESTKQGVKEFIGKADQFDDLTMLSIKIL